MQEPGAKPESAGQEARTCPICGNEFPETMEFCPVCMLCQGLAGGFESGEPPASEETVKLTPLEQVTQRFEHYQLLTGKDGKSVELGRGAMEGRALLPTGAGDLRIGAGPGATQRGDIFKELRLPVAKHGSARKSHAARISRRGNSGQTCIGPVTR